MTHVGKAKGKRKCEQQEAHHDLTIPKMLGRLTYRQGGRKEGEEGNDGV